MKDPYQSLPVGLKLSHVALRRNLDRFAALAHGEARLSADLADFIDLYLEFLDVHDDGETDFIFPALRRHSAGRSTDVAHLDRWESEHRAIESAGRALADVAARVRRNDDAARPKLAEISLALKELLVAHFASEEAVLTPQHLPEMIAAQELEAAQQQIAKKEHPRALRMAGFLVHSLEPAEQRQLLGDAPWLFRKVLLKWVAERKMARFRPFVYERTVAL